MTPRRRQAAGPRQPRARVPERYRPWLFDTGSLTQRLMDACCGEFRVQLLSQIWGRPHPTEARLLGLRPRDCVLVRQVQLRCDGQTWVYARTLLPRATLTGPERRLASLKSRSLGAVLFADPTMQRSRTEIVRLRPTDVLYALVVQSLATPPPEIWGRRTVFHLHGKPLLVSEYFLPDVGAFPA